MRLFYRSYNIIGIGNDDENRKYGRANKIIPIWHVIRRVKFTSQCDRRIPHVQTESMCNRLTVF